MDQLYTLNLHKVTCQLYLNKTGKTYSSLLLKSLFMDFSFLVLLNSDNIPLTGFMWNVFVSKETKENCMKMIILYCIINASKYCREIHEYWFPKAFPFRDEPHVEVQE